jgi:hypothetical protein
MRVYHYFGADGRPDIFREAYGAPERVMKEVVAAIAAGRYKPVADIRPPSGVDPLAFAYAATNNRDDLWHLRQPGIVRATVAAMRHFGDGCRSTSVGDLIVRDGKLWLVDRAGFTEVLGVQPGALLTHLAPDDGNAWIAPSTQAGG